MKTEQEQIIKMTNIIKNDYKQWLDVTGVFPEGSSYYFECLGGAFDCARLLYEAGYGDISEYKAEIEKLKAENARFESNIKVVLEIEKKQAKIDVLNKVKNCRDATDSDCYPYLERIVNKLIKEVQNAEDKG